MKTLRPKSGNSCFGCGADNSVGLKLTFEGNPESATVSSMFTPLPFMSGGDGIMHGGFIALLLDEASSKVLSGLGKQGMTRNIDVSFEKPVRLDQTIRLEANLDRHEGRKHWIEARILNSEGQTLAKSKALFLVLNIKR